MGSGFKTAIPKQAMGRNALFVLFMILSVLLFYAPLRLLVSTSFDNELYSHVIFIPFLSMYLICAQRRTLFFGSAPAVIPGSALIVFGLSLFFSGSGSQASLGQNDYLSLMTFAAVVCWIGGFLLFYGVVAFRLALFPLLFLFFMVPAPDFLMERIILLLQVWSAELSHWFFKLTGVPIFREGFVFHLPGLSVEVAEQCGGIRSSLALFITSILAGHLFLRTGWGKFFLVLFAFPITIFKNAVRIVFLSLYGAYVDPGILSSVAHRRGGIPFFFGALALLGAVLWLLRRRERRSAPDMSLLKSVDGIV
jgi:exosortase